MAHIKKENRAESLYDFAVYAILSPLENKRVYISRTRQNRIYKTYIEHYNLRVTKTKSVFAQAKAQNLLPPIYLLDASKISEKEAFRRCVAWTKYFLEHGYRQMTDDALTDYAADLVQNTKMYYNKIKDEPLEEILQPEGGLFPNYGKRLSSKTNTSGTVVSVRLDKEEYAQVKKQATALGLSLGAYCKSMTLNGRIVTVDLSFISSYINEFSESKNLLRQILTSIYSTGQYYPADLKNIQDCIDHLTHIQETVNEKLTQTIEELRE